MKAVVAYDSVHGNTKQVAEAMAAEILAQGHEAELISVRGTKTIPSGDIMFIGSPTRGGRMTRETANFVENIDANAWKGRTIIAFDTVGPLSKDPGKRDKWMAMIDDGSKNAACRIRDACSARGLSVGAPTRHFAVTGFWGPLASDALDDARACVRDVLAKTK